MQRTKLAGVLVTSGLADALGDGWHQPREVAAKLGLDEAVTRRGRARGVLIDSPSWCPSISLSSAIAEPDHLDG